MLACEVLACDVLECEIFTCGGLSCEVLACDVLAPEFGMLPCEVGVLSGNVGTDDLLDLALLLKAPLLRIDKPLRNTASRGHVGSSGLSMGIDGGLSPTTLLTNLFKPRSILTWIMCEPPELGLFSDGEISSRI